jgi:hypothetical protein
MSCVEFTEFACFANFIGTGGSGENLSFSCSPAQDASSVGKHSLGDEYLCGHLGESIETLRIFGNEMLHPNAVVHGLTRRGLTPT